jgi:hypothetical protein
MSSHFLGAGGILPRAILATLETELPDPELILNYHALYR